MFVMYSATLLNLQVQTVTSFVCVHFTRGLNVLGNSKICSIMGIAKCRDSTLKNQIILHTENDVSPEHEYFMMLKVIYHPVYGMNNYVLI